MFITDLSGVQFSSLPASSLPTYVEELHKEDEDEVEEYDVRQLLLVATFDKP